MKRLSTLFVALFFGLSIGECGQMIAGATLGDRYLKQISKSRHISADSQKEAVNTAVKAAEKDRMDTKDGFRGNRDCSRRIRGRPQIRDSDARLHFQIGGAFAEEWKGGCHYRYDSASGIGFLKDDG